MQHARDTTRLKNSHLNSFLQSSFTFFLSFDSGGMYVLYKVKKKEEGWSSDASPCAKFEKSLLLVWRRCGRVRLSRKVFFGKFLTGSRLGFFPGRGWPLPSSNELSRTSTQIPPFGYKQMYIYSFLDSFILCSYYKNNPSRKFMQNIIIENTLYINKTKFMPRMAHHVSLAW